MQYLTRWRISLAAAQQTDEALSRPTLAEHAEVDITDVIQVYNDAKTFLSGNVNTDLDGDYFVDVTDILLAFYNAKNLVSVIKP